MEVGLGGGHVVLDGNPAPPKRAQTPPIFTPCLLWPNGWMDQDVTWYGCKPRPTVTCVRWGPIPSKGATEVPPTFLPMSIVAKWSPISATAEFL